MAIDSVVLASEALKSFYIDGLRYQFNEVPGALLAQIERDSESVVGKEIVMGLRYGRTGGAGNRADDGNLPTPNARKTKQAKWETKNLFVRIQLTDKLIKASRTNRGAFANMMEQELEDAQTDGKDLLSREAWTDGAGKLATCAVNTSTNTLTLDSVQYLSEGQFIDILNSSNTVTVSEREITAVDDVNKTITISGAAVTTAATDYITLAGNYNLELTGFAAVFTPDNTLYGIPRTTNKWFNPTRVNVNGEISEVGIQSGIDDTERKAGSKINFLAGSYGVRRSYQNLLTAQKQLVNTLELKGGFKALSYNGIPLIADKYAPTGKLYGIDLNDWKMYEMSDWEWLDKDGAVLSRVSGKPAYEATLVKYCDIGCSRPKGQVEFYGITEH